MGNSASKKRRKQEKKLQQKEQQQQQLQQLQQEQQQHAVTVELPPGSPVRSPSSDVVGSSSGGVGVGVGGSVREVPSLRGDKSLHGPLTPLSSGTVRGAPPESPVTKPPPGGTMRRSEP